jgi:hypothetical protein
MRVDHVPRVLDILALFLTFLQIEIHTDSTIERMAILCFFDVPGQAVPPAPDHSSVSSHGIAEWG